MRVIRFLMAILATMVLFKPLAHACSIDQRASLAKAGYGRAEIDKMCESNVSNPSAPSATSSGASDAKDQARELFRQGFDAKQAGDLKTARARFEAGLKLDSTDAKAKKLLSEIKSTLADTAGGSKTTKYKPGDVFRDCPNCPEMVVIPAGSFMMGSPESESGRNANEGPQHLVKISKMFAMSKYPITSEEYSVFLSASGYPQATDCKSTLTNLTKRPQVCVSWQDAKTYTSWLSNHTAARYRLPSEAEWEYAARGGASTRFPWGDSFDSRYSSCGESSMPGCKLELVNGRPNGEEIKVDFFQPNQYGLYSMFGNIHQLVEDCYTGNYFSATTDGSAVAGSAGCGRIVRGGSNSDKIENFRPASRAGEFPPGLRGRNVGFRVVRILSN